MSKSQFAHWTDKCLLLLSDHYSLEANGAGISRFNQGVNPLVEGALRKAILDIIYLLDLHLQRFECQSLLRFFDCIDDCESYSRIIWARGLLCYNWLLNLFNRFYRFGFLFSLNHASLECLLALRLVVPVVYQKRLV